MVDDAIVVIENIERHIQEGEKDTHKAASVAMSEVAGAVIATSLVLVAVFVPVAFFPGTTGILFRQFALTIAFSIAISAFNALTLTPALSAILLGREHKQRGWFFSRVEKVIHAVTEGYRHALRAFLRFRLVAVILFFSALGCTYLMFQHVPKGFVPSEDQGYFIIAIQAPAGSFARIHQGHRPAGSAYSAGGSRSRRHFRHFRIQLYRQRLQPGHRLRSAKAVFASARATPMRRTPW